MHLQSTAVLDIVDDELDSSGLGLLGPASCQGGASPISTAGIAGCFEACFPISCLFVLRQMFRQTLKLCNLVSKLLI